MMVTLKYVFIVLHADNEGEGGTFSTYALLSRFVSLPCCVEGDCLMARPGKYIETRP